MSMNLNFKTNLAKLSLATLSMAALPAMAQDFIAVSKDAKVFDEPNAKGYVTLNQKNQEVHVTPGMAFKQYEETKGWYMIEYSPGLRGYVSKFHTDEAVTPKAGTYKIANNPEQKITVSLSGDKWSATVGDKTYPGKMSDNIVIFYDENKKKTYSLVDFGDGPVAISYDNTITKFF